VFLPVAFMGGIVGRFMNSFGLTMAFSIIVSLLVSFVLTPMLCARWLKRQGHKPSERAAARGAPVRRAQASEGVYGLIERGYMRDPRVVACATAGSSSSPASRPS
jgi:HAE1 family hydrophobic/amphiphilic exporter-1